MPPNEDPLDSVPALYANRFRVERDDGEVSLDFGQQITSNDTSVHTRIVTGADHARRLADAIERALQPTAATVESARPREVAGDDEAYQRIRNAIDLLRTCLQRALEHIPARYEFSEAGQARGRTYRGLYVSSEEASHLIARETGQPITGSSEGPQSIEPFGRLTLWGDVAKRAGMTPVDVALTVLALAPEVDSTFGRLFAYLQDDVTRKRPTVGLAIDLFSWDAASRMAAIDRFAADSPLVRTGILKVVPDPSQVDPALPDLYLKLDAEAVAYLFGHSRSAIIGEWTRFVEPTHVDPEELPPLAVAVARDARRQGRAAAIYLQGPAQADAQGKARGIAAAVGVPLIEADLEMLPETEMPFNAVRDLFRAAWLRNAFVYFSGADAIEPHSARALALQRALGGPTVVMLIGGSDPWRLPPFAVPLVTVSITNPDSDARRTIWDSELRAARLQIDDASLVMLGARYTLGAEQIADAVTLTRATVMERRPQQPSSSQILSMLTQAARAGSGQELGRLAARVDTRSAWADIVIPDDVRAQLMEICDRVRYRDRVLDDWGFEQKIANARAVTALFSGPPGTGKTLAASIVANELELDLYRIDLASTVSKYIGETEKNLERIFTAAELANAILLFDEADALFSKRSDVRDAHDRYANIEVSYLLQRMERYQGVSILSTNFRGNLDEAFTRRLSFAVQFPLPDEPQRFAIWQRIWPGPEIVDSGVDLRRLAKNLPLSGGHIRNISLAATFIAAGAQQPRVMVEHLLQAIKREYQKLGRTITEDELDGIVREQVA